MSATGTFLNGHIYHTALSLFHVMRESAVIVAFQCPMSGGACVLVYCVDVNIRFLLATFEEGAGNDLQCAMFYCLAENGMCSLIIRQVLKMVS
jgi:hypothetical protein